MRFVFCRETDLVTERGPVDLVCRVGFVREKTVWTATVFEITNVRFEIAEWTKRVLQIPALAGRLIWLLTRLWFSPDCGEYLAFT